MPNVRQLPTKLNKEPLIDAIFEVRFAGAFPVSEVLPGFLFSKLKGNKSITSLSTSQLPKAIRESDSNLRFAPLIRLEWNEFLINVSDHSVSVSCKYPYPGWGNFKPAIIEIFDVLKTIPGFQAIIERYSMKYVDLISSTNLEEQLSFLNFELTIAELKLKKERFQIRVEIPQENFINAIQLISSATVKLVNGVVKEGVVIDVDTILNLDNVSLEALLDDFPSKLDNIHYVNKTVFFSCLKSETIAALEPVYERN